MKLYISSEVNAMGWDLAQRLGRMRLLDKETHSRGKQLYHYDLIEVDYVNLERKLSVSEAGDVYEGLEKHPSLILYGCVLEEPAVRETFTSGYSVLFAPPGKERECVLTVGEKQLPEEYRERFEAFTTSAENKRRARAAGMDYISQFAGGSTEEPQRR
ncbi:hypothetical protein J4439_00435 [Candidatus Woesearchaeota archaeon]|nr:hypothetical protein [Candidatus Woesearchaeota archaeon]